MAGHRAGRAATRSRAGTCTSPGSPPSKLRPNLDWAAGGHGEPRPEDRGAAQLVCASWEWPATSSWVAVCASTSISRGRPAIVSS